MGAWSQGATDSILLAPKPTPDSYVGYNDKGADATANESDYQWGGTADGADKATGAANANAAKWSTRTSPWDQNVRNQQLAVSTMLQGDGGPSIAGDQAQASRDATIRMAMTGQAQGGQQLAAMAPAMGQIQAQAGQQRAQDAQQREQLFAGNLAQGRQADINETSFDAKQQAAMEQFYMRQGFNIQQAQLAANIAKSAQNVTNWQRYNQDWLAQQDAGYRRTAQQNQIAQQHEGALISAGGSLLATAGKAAT